MSELAGGHGPSRLSHRARILLVAWYLASGWLLFVAPWTEGIWNESFHAWSAPLHETLMSMPMRVAISAFGFVLFLAAIAETLAWRTRGDRP